MLQLYYNNINHPLNIISTLETRTAVPFVNSNHTLLNNNDPFQSIVQHQQDQQQQHQNIPTVVFTDDKTLLKALPHLNQLAPNTIINIDTNDYQSIINLKDLNFISLISSTKQDTINALTLSHLLIKTTKTPILHFIDYQALSNDSSNFKIPKNLSKILETELDNDNNNNNNDNISSALNILNSNGLKYSFIDYQNGSNSSKIAIIHLGNNYNQLSKAAYKLSLPIINIKIFKPFEISYFLQNLPSSIDSIAILENSISKPFTKISPLLLEFFQSPNYLIDNGINKITASSIGNYNDSMENLLKIIISNLSINQPIQNLYFGDEILSSSSSLSSSSLSSLKKDELIKINKLESTYISILNQLFNSTSSSSSISKNSLKIFNQFNDENINISSPEFGFGSFIYHSEQQKKLINLIHKSLQSPEKNFNTPKLNELIELLSKWLVYIRDDNNNNNDNDHIESSTTIDQIQSFNQISDEILNILEFDVENSTPFTKKLLSFKNEFYMNSSWLIGSDSWAYDLGSSGVHHVLESNENINVMIIDNETFDSKKNGNKSIINRKKDIGLYAMNYGNAYVGSIAIYSSYTQMLTTLIEAASFKGPSIILAYLPISNEDDSPLNILLNTKKSIDSGFIPLYRYNPFLNSINNQFKLDSSILKENLKNFLNRENKLTLLSSKDPIFQKKLNNSLNLNIKLKQKKIAKFAFNKLINDLNSGPPISIYFASDGGNAENLAKKLNEKALSFGFNSIVLSMDEINIEDLIKQEIILFITSTSGQGEIPTNGKKFWDFLKNNGGDVDFLKFNKISVFGLGDSEYWPRPQDKHYYNKPAKDLFNRLIFLNAKELIPLGLGDDQDSDGYQTGYQKWEKILWETLGVDELKIKNSKKNEKPSITNEDIKIQSNYLRGDIINDLKDESTGSISSFDQQLTKFHGIYMQDDRDLRDSRKSASLEPFYIFMARVRLPGGITSPDQWLMLNKLADERGNGTIKLTTRATYQLHGIVKHNLKPSIRAMNSVLMDTLGACGDVNRNVMISALPENRFIHNQVDEISKKISQHLLPQTTAYHEIWLEGSDTEDPENEDWEKIFNERKDGPKKIKTLVAGNSLVDDEPIYGKTYLPRKFKINITIPPYNDVDVWSSDVGLITIVENNQVIGFNVLVGGGMGTTHNNKKTYPRTGSSFGFVSIDQIHIVCEKIMIIQRDFGNRKDRKNARLKYTIDSLGVENFKLKVEELWGEKFKIEKPFEIKDNIDHFGWVTDELNEHHFTCFIENGRVEDTVELPQKQGLKKIAEYFKSRGGKSNGSFRLTGNQHLLISCISNDELNDVKKILKDYKLDNSNFSGLRLSSAACVAFPTCGLAMAESERYLPLLINKIEESLEEYGLRHDSIVMRMTGCPNGCARPWLAEIALVGKAYGVYNLMLGGGYHGQRLNKIYKQNIKEDEILKILKPLFKRWALERIDDEHFGDFLIRIGIIAPTLEGKYFHDDIPEQV